jgi:hypothetical protein
MTARVRAKELRFACKPEVRVVVWADPSALAESGSERENLPDELEPGVPYRDFEIRWRAAARLTDPDLDSDPE